MEAKKPEITAGVSVSLTGGFALQGRHALDGLRLWASNVNKRGGIYVPAQGYKPVRLTYYDNASQVNRARQNALQLLCEDRVDILFGPYASNLTMAIAEIAGDHGKILWNHGGSSDEISALGNVISIASPASDYLRHLPSWLA